MVLHKSITLLWSNTKAIQYILGCMRVCIWSMVILYWHHHCFWLYCPFSTLTITPLCRAESKSDKNGTILLRYHSQYLLHTTAAALHAKRKCHYIRCAVGLVPFLCTEPAAFFPLHIVGCIAMHMNIRQPQELCDKIFADVTQSDVLLAYRETNMR